MESASDVTPVRRDDEADPWSDDPELARRVVREGPGSLREAGKIAGTVGNLILLTRTEARAYAGVKERITAYLGVPSPKRPLCLGVFGPPGSGKSFGVEELLREVLGYGGETLNLSQIEGPGQLGERMKRVRDGAMAGQVPAVFFDEFDSRLAGTPLGWLQWLLAPMQDGVFTVGDEEVELKRAIFVFAGGTADTFEQFQGGPAREFRAAKGPDFVSRLRGHLNVLGVNNGPYRRVRRALVLRRALETVAPALLDEGRLLPDAMDDEFIDQLLGIGRYRHGARSVEALVEMSTSPNQRIFTAKHLPVEAVRSNHVDLGAFGDTVVALSAAGTVSEKAGAEERDAPLHHAWHNVATRLLEQGAALVYGGRPRPGGFLTRLVLVHVQLPKLLPPDEEKRQEPEVGTDAPRPATVTWVREEDPHGPHFDGLRELQRPELSDEELRELGIQPGMSRGDWNHEAHPAEGSPELQNRLASVVKSFRMRALVTRFAHAHLAIGGRTTKFKARFPGVVEELMLSLASGTPVFVCGGFGGGAHAAGETLGLGKPWATVPAALRADTHGPWAAVLEATVQQHRDFFQLPHRTDLPVDYRGLVEFLREHALGSARWPSNGLSRAENRALFTSTDAGEIFRLVESGLRALRER